ncbi:MAG: VIT1/CCC1 transporter family protein [Candidatus Binatia bacterium]
MGEATKTRTNLQIALASEADASGRYTAYGIRALHEGYPEIAQLFFEAAGAETVHAYSHLATLGAIGTTSENLQRAARGETGEIERLYPRMIAEAEAEGVPTAATSFRLALEREKHHQQMFRNALAVFQEREARFVQDGASLANVTSTTHSAELPARSPESPQEFIPQAAEIPRGVTPDTLVNELRHGQRHSEARAGDPQHIAPTSTTTVDRRAAKLGLSEIAGERERIVRLASIREIVFGGQDGLISTTTLVAGLAATSSQSHVVFIAGAIAAAAGAVSMAVGSYLSSRAQRQLYEAEIAAEQQEIADKPGEEMAELLAALIGRGMSKREAIEVVRRVGRHPKIMLDMLGAFELGLTPESLGSPLRDALVIGSAFVVGAVIPLAPFLLLDIRSGLAVTTLLALLALFALGAGKARLSGRPVIVSGLEVMGLGGAGGIFGYGLGYLVSVLFDIQI